MALTDWRRCAICQIDTDEKLTCPGRSKRNDAGIGYEIFAANAVAFSELGELPVSIDLARLDQGNGIVKTLSENEAQWHKSCYQLFKTSKLQKKCTSKKRKQETSADGNIKLEGSPVKMARSCSRNKFSDPMEFPCFFCGSSDGEMSTVRTLELDKSKESADVQAHVKTSV